VTIDDLKALPPPHISDHHAVMRLDLGAIRRLAHSTRLSKTFVAVTYPHNDDVTPVMRVFANYA
jgi:hypothetical protein